MIDWVLDTAFYLIVGLVIAVFLYQFLQTKIKEFRDREEKK